jgi:hypothetical protein
MVLAGWSDKVKNKIVDYDLSNNIIQTSDIIIYQEISKEKSLFCNTELLQAIKKESCRLIKIPSMYFNYSNYNNSMEELIGREIKNNVDITISDIYEKYRDRNLMNTVNHPNTFLFLEVVDKLCSLLNIDTFSKNQTDIFLQNNNYMELP